MGAAAPPRLRPGTRDARLPGSHHPRPRGTAVLSAEHAGRTPQEVGDLPSWLAVSHLAAGAGPGHGEVEAFLAQHASPIVEGPFATFVFQGRADRVLLRHAVVRLSNPLEFHRLPGTDLWFKTLLLPPASRLEYQLECVGGEGSGHRFNDPRNPRLGWGPFGAQSVCAGSGYVDPEWAEPDGWVRGGELIDLSVHSQALGHEVFSQIYLPSGFQPGGRYPLLLIHDGSDFLRYAAGRVVLDNLIHRGEVAPLVAAFVHAGPGRLTEYANDHRHAAFLARELLPEIERRFGVTQPPRDRTLMGSSFGGIAALSTAARYPARFGGLLLESASLVFTDGGRLRRGDSVFRPVVAFVNAYRARARPVVHRLYQSCGAFEPLIGPNRSMVDVFRSTGMEVRYEEANDGHQWVCWRDRLRSGLTFLHPGPAVPHNGAQP